MCGVSFCSFLTFRLSLRTKLGTEDKIFPSYQSVSLFHNISYSSFLSPFCNFSSEFHYFLIFNQFLIFFSPFEVYFHSYTGLLWNERGMNGELEIQLDLDYLWPANPNTYVFLGSLFLVSHRMTIISHCSYVHINKRLYSRILTQWGFSST